MLDAVSTYLWSNVLISSQILWQKHVDDYSVFKINRTTLCDHKTDKDFRVSFGLCLGNKVQNRKCWNCWYEKTNTVSGRVNIRYIRNIRYTSHEMRHPSWWQSEVECLVVMSENGQRLMEERARVHNQMQPWKSAKTSGGQWGVRNEQWAHQSIPNVRLNSAIID